MAREVVRICLTPSFPPEAGATFFSTIAYPGRSEILERDQFWFALCRWAINQRCQMDHEWKWTPQAIRPDIFLRLNTNWLQVLNRGMKRWEDETQCDLLYSDAPLRSPVNGKTVPSGPKN